MLKDEEKKELEALKAKTDLTEAEKKRMADLDAKAKETNDETFSKDYVETLRKENAKYRIRAKEADEKLASYDGIDPDEYKKLKDAAAKAEQDKLKSEGAWDKLREKLVADHNAEMTKKDAEVVALKANNEKLEADIGRTIRSHEVAVEASIAEAINPKLVELVVESKTKVEVDKDGKRTITVLDTDGAPSIDAKTGKPKTIAQLLQDMKTSVEYAHLFKGGNDGAGSRTDNFDGKSVKNPWKADSLNLTLQGQIIKANPEMARRMIKEVGKNPQDYGL